MLAVLVALVLWAVAELYVLVQVGSAIGVLNTIGLLLAFSIVGIWLTKHEGLWVLTRTREQLDQRRMPTNELIDGVLVLIGGLLLIIPVFISDGIGLLLLFPPTRGVARSIAKRRLRIRVYGVGLGFPGDNGRIDGPDDVIDV